MASGRKVKLIKPAPATVGFSETSLNLEMRDNFLRDISWFLAALLGQNERGVRLIIAKACVGRRRYFTRLGQTGFGESIGQSSPEKGLERFHGGANSAYACARSRKIDKISSADGAVARLSRTERSFKNFAIEASVRRCV